MLMNQYGRGDATFLALGGLEGVRELVDAFYTTMEREEDYQVLWTLHTEDRETMRDKLALFLSMWSGGPKNYICLLYTSPSPRDRQKSRMPSSA